MLVLRKQLSDSSGSLMEAKINQLKNIHYKLHSIQHLCL